ncbi:DnaD domain protein [Romboutsia sp. 1001713B170207_170306_H8]|uniref:DnaD domain protein n=1 Tax=Romboutsia sp. 1001713B170207_170306_H8 TaxID=2787112 RepID=UPI00082185DC|nr:DnaD domain protein [Romboutsia sp. 1001713B170207_170306_H8]SCH48637.1 DnaD domain protein [uncultured Clostridium sp.]
MALYRHVRSEIWVNPKVSECMNSNEKLIFVYLLTNQHTTQIGIYKITKKQIAYDLDLPMNIVEETLEKFENDLKIIVYNKSTYEIAITKWGRFNLTNSGRPIKDCIKKELLEVKDVELLKVISEHIRKEEIKELFDNAYDNVALTLGGQKENKKEKQKENEKEILKNSNDLSKYAKLYTENIGVINGIVSQWLIEISDSVDLLLFKKAIEIATNKGKCSKGYVQGIINQWKDKNIRSIEDLDSYKLQEKINKSSNIRSLKFEEEKVNYSKPSEEYLAYARSLSAIN